MKRIKPTYKNIEYDSQEEIWFVIWLEEAESNGYVYDWEYHIETFELSPKVLDDDGKMILRPHTYKPDFTVEFFTEFNHRFPFNGITYAAERTISVKGYSKYLRRALIDVKGKYARGGRNQFPNSSAISFPLNQKWIYQKYGIFINAIQPSSTRVKGRVTKKGFFAKTFVPGELAFAKNRKILTRRKEFDDCRLLKEL